MKRILFLALSFLFILHHRKSPPNKVPPSIILSTARTAKRPNMIPNIIMISKITILFGVKKSDILITSK